VLLDNEVVCFVLSVCVKNRLWVEFGHIMVL
jgi:hypothetical protein